MTRIWPNVINKHLFIYLFHVIAPQLFLWGKCLHGCLVRTDKCHFNLSRITFTLLLDSTEDSTSLKFVSFICWQPFHTFRNRAIVVDQSIIPPVCDQISGGAGVAWFFKKKNSQLSNMFRIFLKYSHILKFQGRPGSRRQKHVPLLFFPTRHGSSQAQI